MTDEIWAHSFGPDDGNPTIRAKVAYQYRRWVIGVREYGGSANISAFHCCKPTKWVLMQVALWTVEKRLACYHCNEEAPDHIYTMMRLLLL